MDLEAETKTVKLNARGKIIETKLDVIGKSPRFASLYKYRSKEEKNYTFELPFDEHTVHRFLDYLSRGKVKKDIDDICDYMEVKLPIKKDKSSITFEEVIPTILIQEKTFQHITRCLVFTLSNSETVAVSITIKYTSKHDQFLVEIKDINTRYKFENLNFPGYSRTCICKRNTYDCQVNCYKEGAAKLLYDEVVPVLIKILGS